MKVLNSKATTLLAASLITAGGYLAGSGTKAMLDKNDKLTEQNIELRTELIQKESKIDSLTHDVAELKRQKAEIEYKQELDSLNKFYQKNLGTDFYERIVNNAAFLDNYNYPYTRMQQVVNKIPDDELMNMHDVSQARYEASENITNFAKSCPKYFDYLED